MSKARVELVVLVALLFLYSLGIFLYWNLGEIPILMLFLYWLIGTLALISIFMAYKKMKEEKEGQPVDDEFTLQIKYKSGYYAYIYSLYMWLFLFLGRSFFQDIETIVGIGVLMSGLIGYVCKMYIKRHNYEK